MKQIQIQLQPDKVLKLPISYNQLVQAAIYKLLSKNPAYAEGLHQQGFLYGKRKYKLFTFGKLNGEKKIAGKQVTFLARVGLEIRTVDDRFADLLTYALQEKSGILLGDTWCELVKLDVGSPGWAQKEMIIQMLAPLTVYQTLEDKKTKYYNPLDKEFSRLIQDNLKRKYYAAYMTEAKGNIVITARNLKSRNRCVTTFKSTYIESWYGEYKLEGPADQLEFLYYTGIGSKNSQGFGMFRVVELKKDESGWKHEASE